MGAWRRIATGVAHQPYAEHGSMCRSPSIGRRNLGRGFTDGERASARGRLLSVSWTRAPGVSERERPKIPRATYRLQFRKEFGFDDAAELAPYLASLGISHVYASPYLKARPGSTHGYDIVDHNELNPELGSPESFERMVAAFREHGLGQILDFVPNHMGVGGADNSRWLDVLEWGPDSEFAEWFDIEWHPDRGYLQDKVLVPFLGDQYGRELQAGSLVLKFDAEAGEFSVWAYETHKLPVCAAFLRDYPREQRSGA